jgi:hypothetical protein
MEQERTFKTKTGFCHISDDKIVLTRDGIIGNVSKLTVGNSIQRTLAISGILSFVLFYSAYEGYRQGNSFEPVFYILIGVVLIINILTSINNSATPIIERTKIRSVHFKKAIWGLTRSRFEVLFEDENGKLKKRLIMLPGSLTGGDEETEQALKIMAEEGLINEKQLS